MYPIFYKAPSLKYDTLEWCQVLIGHVKIHGNVKRCFNNKGIQIESSVKTTYEIACQNEISITTCIDVAEYAYIKEYRFPENWTHFEK